MLLDYDLLSEEHRNNGHPGIASIHVGPFYLCALLTDYNYHV